MRTTNQPRPLTAGSAPLEEDARRRAPRWRHALWLLCLAAAMVGPGRSAASARPSQVQERPLTTAQKITLRLEALDGQGLMPDASALRQQSELEYLWQVLDVYWANQDWPRALQTIDQIVAADPNYRNVQERKYYAHVAYGYDLLTLGQCDLARAQFDQALTVRPGGQEALNGLNMVNQYCPTPAPWLTITPTNTPGPSATPSPTPTCFAVTKSMTITVKAGDTLSSLARCFEVSEQAIMKANGMMNEALRAGSVLEIPGPAEVPPGPLVHIVQPGETLFSIAQKYKTTVWAIMQVNGLRGASVYAYQAVYIPSLLQPGPFIHIVQPDQTLYTIAQRYKISVDLIMLANNLKSYDIRVFQRIVIPPEEWTGWPPIAVWTSPGPEGSLPRPRYYRVLPGDTLYSIARRYGTTVGQIKTINGLQGSLIYAGMLLRLPQ